METFPKSAPTKSFTEIIKIFNSNSFKSDWKKQLRYTESYECFKNVFFNVLQRHTVLKEKVIRANHAPYTSRTLRKAFMKRSKVERNYLKHRANESRRRFQKRKDICSNLYKKERKIFHSSIRIEKLYRQWKVCRTVEPLISDKGVCSSRIPLVHMKEENKTEKNKIADSSNEIISDDLDIANILNKNFQNAITKFELLSTRETLVQT